MINSIRTADAVMVLHCQLLFSILVIAQIAVIGDFISMWSPIAMIISTCVTSFVVLVIRLLVWNFFISFIDRF